MDVLGALCLALWLVTGHSLELTTPVYFVTLMVPLVVAFWCEGPPQGRAQERVAVDVKRQSHGIQWNSVLDLLLELVRERIVARGLDTVALPDIDHVIAEGTVSAISAGNGSLTGLSTVQRTGDAIVRRVPGTRRLKVTCPVGLDRVHVEYGTYCAQAAILGVQTALGGSVKVTVRTNSVSVQVVLDLAANGFTASLLSVHVYDLEGLDVQVEGHMLDCFISSLASSYAITHKYEIKGKIEEGLRHCITNQIDWFNSQHFMANL